MIANVKPFSVVWYHAVLLGLLQPLTYATYKSVPLAISSGLVFPSWVNLSILATLSCIGITTIEERDTHTKSSSCSASPQQAWNQRKQSILVKNQPLFATINVYDCRGNKGLQLVELDQIGYEAVAGMSTQLPSSDVNLNRSGQGSVSGSSSGIGQLSSSPCPPRLMGPPTSTSDNSSVTQKGCRQQLATSAPVSSLLPQIPTNHSTQNVQAQLLALLNGRQMNPTPGAPLAIGTSVHSSALNFAQSTSPGLPIQLAQHPQIQLTPPDIQNWSLEKLGKLTKFVCSIQYRAKRLTRIIPKFLRETCTDADPIPTAYSPRCFFAAIRR